MIDQKTLEPIMKKSFIKKRKRRKSPKDQMYNKRMEEMMR